MGRANCFRLHPVPAEPNVKHQKPLRIALTGGIASGKSAVASEFARLGVPIVDLDELARHVVEPGQPALMAIVARFGKGILSANGRLNRGQLRERIFNHPQEKSALEAILHPAIRAAQMALAAQLDGPYQIHVVPLLIETQSQSLYDRILVVDCDRDTQLRRLLGRDNIRTQLAEQILATQADRKERLKYADDVLENTGDIDELVAKVGVLHRLYLELAIARASE